MIELCTTPSPAVVPAAVRKLRERLQKEARERAVLERALQRLGAHAGLTADTITVDFDLGAPPGLTRSSRLDGEGTGQPEPALSSFWPRAQPPRPAALRPTPGLACYAMKERCDKIVGIWTLGLDQAGLALALRRVAEQQLEENDFLPIFFTDLACFELFREHGFVFEYLPPANRRTRGHLAWDAYVQQRLAQAVQMWGITHLTAYGDLAAPFR
jgi:hypothetical protein